MFKKNPENKTENPAPAPAPIPAPAPAPAPAQNEAGLDVVEKIKAWKAGDELEINGVSGYVFNDLNGIFAEDKTNRGFRFNYDQTHEVLTVVDDK